MGKSSPAPPPVPDPVATAQAQTVSNQETARTNTALNRVDQIGPDGQTMYYKNPLDPDHYTQLTSLSPQGQRIFDNTRNAQEQYTKIGGAQLQRAAGTLSTPYADPNAGMQTAATQAAGGALRTAQNAAGQPINTDYNSVRQQAIDAANSRLQPERQMQDEELRSRLLNSGITEGSAAWNNAYRQFNNSNNDAQQQTILHANDLANQSIGQTAALRQIPLSEQTQVANIAGNVSNLTGAGVQQSTAVRNQPLNETAALLSGQQVSQPQFGAVPQTNVAPTDVLGANQLSAGVRNNNYNAQVASTNSANGGMYALGGTALVAGAIAI